MLISLIGVKLYCSVISSCFLFFFPSRGYGMFGFLVLGVDLKKANKIKQKEIDFVLTCVYFLQSGYMFPEIY